MKSPFVPSPSMRRVSVRGIDLQHQKDGGGHRGADARLLVEPASQIEGDGQAREHGQQAEGRRDRDLQDRRVWRDARLPAGHRRVRDNEEQPADDRQRDDRDHPGPDG